MATPKARRLLTVAAVAATLITLSACGDNAQPSPDPSESATSVIGEPSGEASPTDTATTATPTSTGSSGGGGGGGNSPYPGNAKDYGLAMLAAIASSNDTRIVDLSSIDTANYINTQNYKSKNGQWTHANCDSGGTQYCHYYNQTGDFASVAVDSGKLGSKGAVSSVTMEGNSFAGDAAGYVGQFVYNWTYDTGFVRMRAYATQQVVDAVRSKQKLNAGNGGTTTSSVTCPSAHQGRACVEASAVGGSLTISYIFVVDQSKLGKPNAIIAVV